MCVSRELLGYYVLVNAAAFFAFGEDKRRAIQRKWRIRESTLMALAAAGGALGAFAGMRIFHHKTRHRKFSLGIPALLTVQIALLAKLGGN